MKQKLVLWLIAILELIGQCPEEHGAFYNW